MLLAFPVFDDFKAVVRSISCPVLDNSKKFCRHSLHIWLRKICIGVAKRGRLFCLFQLFCFVFFYHSTALVLWKHREHPEKSFCPLSSWSRFQMRRKSKELGYNINWKTLQLNLWYFTNSEYCYCIICLCIVSKLSASISDAAQILFYVFLQQAALCWGPSSSAVQLKKNANCSNQPKTQLQISYFLISNIFWYLYQKA